MSDLAYMLAQRIGIDPNVIRAIERVESGGRPNAVRFEPHLFHRDTGGRQPDRTIRMGRYGTQVPWTPERGNVSLTPSETNRAAFERAFRLDPATAVTSTSWGTHQVLGGAGLTLYGTPSAFVRAFDANPEQVSAYLLAEWFRQRPDVIAAANRHDWSYVAWRYNGSRTSPWHRRFEAALAELGGTQSGMPWWGWLLGAAALGGAAYGGVRLARRYL